MKEGIDEVKSAIKAKVLYWNNIKSRKIKASLIVLFLVVAILKIFTTVLTFDWIADLLNSI